jgi:hypothetical protein
MAAASIRSPPAHHGNAGLRPPATVGHRRGIARRLVVRVARLADTHAGRARRLDWNRRPLLVLPLVQGLLGVFRNLSLQAAEQNSRSSPHASQSRSPSSHRPTPRTPDPWPSAPPFHGARPKPRSVARRPPRTLTTRAAPRRPPGWRGAWGATAAGRRHAGGSPWPHGSLDPLDTPRTRKVRCRGPVVAGRCPGPPPGQNRRGARRLRGPQG